MSALPTMDLCLVIPIFNEEKGIAELIRQLEVLKTAMKDDLRRVILVENGSTDASRSVLQRFSKIHWLDITCLDKNQGYGGGVWHGIQHSGYATSHIGWIPADLQYKPDDIAGIWRKVRWAPEAVHKGYRATRADGAMARFVSATYSLVARAALGITARDINGLPKIFPSELLREFPRPIMQSFTLDAQLLTWAVRRRVLILEHSVGFYRRRSGVSSWSNKRIRTYLKTLREIGQIRRTLGTPAASLATGGGERARQDAGKSLGKECMPRSARKS